MPTIKTITKLLGSTNRSQKALLAKPDYIEYLTNYFIGINKKINKLKSSTNPRSKKFLEKYLNFLSRHIKLILRSEIAALIDHEPLKREITKGLKFLVTVKYKNYVALQELFNSSYNSISQRAEAENCLVRDELSYSTAVERTASVSVNAGAGASSYSTISLGLATLKEILNIEDENLAGEEARDGREVSEVSSVGQVSYSPLFPPATGYLPPIRRYFFSPYVLGCLGPESLISLLAEGDLEYQPDSQGVSSANI